MDLPRYNLAKGLLDLAITAREMHAKYARLAREDYGEWVLQEHRESHRTEMVLPQVERFRDQLRRLDRKKSGGAGSGGDW